jgi:phage protein D
MEDIMRHADVAITYQGVDITSSIADDLVSFEYDEVSDGDADSLSISLKNKGLKWMNNWFPTSGDIIRPSLISHDWNYPGEMNTLNCGSLTVDDPEFSGPPDKLDLKALSTPAAAGWNDEPGDYTWASISMKQLGQYVASKYGLSYTYDVPTDFTMTALKCSSQTYADFLNDTANKYNICTKVYSNQLILYDKATYEARTPVAAYTLGSSNISNYKLSAPTVGTGYSAAVETYSLSGSSTKLSYEFRIAPGGKALQLNESVDDTSQAEMAAKAALRQANEQQYAGSLTLSLDLRLVAACTIMLAGFGNFDGKYFVDSCKHTYGSGAGQTEIDIHKVLTGGY